MPIRSPKDFAPAVIIYPQKDLNGTVASVFKICLYFAPYQRYRKRLTKDDSMKNKIEFAIFRIFSVAKSPS